MLYLTWRREGISQGQHQANQHPEKEEAVGNIRKGVRFAE